MMCLTNTASSNSPVLLIDASLACAKPTSVARTLAKAGWGLARSICKSRTNTSSAGSPSRCVTKWPSHAVTVCTGAIGKHPCVTREMSATSASKATPLKPPWNTPPALPCPAMFPSPRNANCTTSARLDAKPPNTYPLSVRCASSAINSGTSGVCASAWTSAVCGVNA